MRLAARSAWRLLWFRPAVTEQPCREVDESDEDAYIQDFIDNLEAQQAGESSAQVWAADSASYREQVCTGL